MSTDEVEFRCGAHARRRADALAGTAAPAVAWLLVEDTGPWARRAFEDSPNDPDAGRAIVARTRELAARPLFVRRHGRRPTDSRFAYVTAQGMWSGWRDYRSLAEVAEADWSATQPAIEPMFLVCTHGRHDRCCAIAGRPVARQFDRMRPDTTWECSHLGGDRFAGNVLVVPTGATYGFVDPLDVPSLVAATEEGGVFLPLLRGIATDTPVEQAARIAAQTRWERSGADEFRVLGSEQVGSDTWLVRLADERSQAIVEVRQERVADARATCAHTQPVAMREWRVVSVTPTDFSV